VDAGLGFCGQLWTGVNAAWTIVHGKFLFSIDYQLVELPMCTLGNACPQACRFECSCTKGSGCMKGQGKFVPGLFEFGHSIFVHIATYEKAY
jgi:hypothetical protein